MCICKGIEFGSKECYDQQIFIVSKNISVDPCIYNELTYLWRLGITTYGSCCGHNKVQSMVNVDKKDIDFMLALGYEQNHPDKDRKDTFKLKSA